MTTGAPPAGIAIVGPTASGKTTLSLEVARRLDGEIISLDSRQIYRGMDIGTAKATPAQQRAVPHHGLNIADPSERFSAGRFARLARGWVEEIRGRGRVPIFAGGTGFFLRALTNPIFREPDLDPARRRALQLYLERRPADESGEWLLALDRDTAERLGSGGGRQRVLRALEIALLTGRPLSWWQRHAPPEAPPLGLRIFVLDPPREHLFRAIDLRVHEMVRNGLLDEVRLLRERGYDSGDPGMNATGYSEMIAALDGQESVEAAADRVRRSTRAYARRQLTWLRHQLPADAVWLDPMEPLSGLAERIEADWRDTIAATKAGATSQPSPRHQPSRRREAE